MSDLDQPAEPRQRRRDTVAAAATAAAVLVVGVAFLLTRGGPSPHPPPAAPRVLQECGAGDLVAGRNRLQVAAGTTYLVATLELAPDVEPCSVDGFPAVIVLSGGRPAGVATVSDDSLGKARQLTVLPDRSAKVTLGWPVSHYCGPVVNDTLRLWVSSDLRVEVPGFGPSSCGPGEGRPPVRVGPFTYVDPSAQRGTATGVVTLNGGPAPGTGEFVTSGEVTFVGESDSYRASIGPDGSYETTLPEGHYAVTVSTHQWNGGATYRAGSFDVTGGELNELSITLPVR